MKRLTYRSPSAAARLAWRPLPRPAPFTYGDALAAIAADVLAARLAANEIRRAAGEDALATVWAAAGTLQRFAPFSVSAASVSAPVPLRAGLRPVHDSRNSPPAPARLSDADLIRRAVHALAVSIVSKRANGDARALAAFAELVSDTTSAAHEALAVRTAGRPRTLAALIAALRRLAGGMHPRPAFVGAIKSRPLSSLLPRTVWRAGCKACDQSMRKMTRGDAGDLLAQASRLLYRANNPRKGEKKTPAALREEAGKKTELAALKRDARSFDAAGCGEALLASLPAHVHPSEDERDEAARLAVIAITARAGQLRDAIAAAAAAKGTRYAARDAAKFIVFVNEAEAAAIAAARGEPFAALPAFGFKVIRRVNVSETLAVSDAAGRPLAGGGTRKTKAGGEREPFARLFARWTRLRAFVGEVKPCPVPRPLSDEVKAENYRLDARRYAGELAALRSRPAVPPAPVPALRPALRPLLYIRDYTQGGAGENYAARIA